MAYPIYYVEENDVLPILFDSFDGGTGASATISGLAVTDIEIYKDGSATQRASDAGYALLDTDGIDFDGITGINGFSIDLSDNTTAGFYTVGSWYHVVVSSVTIDAQTVNFIAAAFRIVSGTRGLAGTALPNAAADAAGGLSISDAGGLDLDARLDAAVSSRMATYTQPTGFLAATFPSGTVANTTNITAGTITTVTTTTNLTNLPSIPANWLTAAGTAADFGTEVGTAVWATTTRVLTAGTNIQLPANGLANVTAWTVDITGNLSGSVGSVTGAVGSVTGNIGGNVAGSVGSVTAAVTLPTIPTDWITADGLAADAVAEINAGSGLLELVSGTIQNADDSLIDLGALTYGDDELNDHLIVVFDDSTGEFHGRFIDDYAATGSLVLLNAILPFTTESGVDTYKVYAMRRDDKVTNVIGLIGSPAGGTVATAIAAVKAETAAILVDTAEIGAAGVGLTEAGGTGDHLTAINLPNQTMDITGNITGNLSGSVGSVTGAVGSVTAAVTLPTIPTDWISAAGVAADAVAKINLGSLNVYATGTADAGSSQILLVDAERTEPNGGYFFASRVLMTSGSNVGQSRPIFSFSAASDTIVLTESFQNAIAAGDTYAILNDHSADVGMWGHNLIIGAINGMLPAINVAVNASGFSYTGTADGGSTTTLDDAARIGDGDDFWNGNKIRFTNGNLAGIERLIVDYNSTSGTFTLAPPLPNAVTTQAYAIVSASMQDANATHWIGTEITEQPHTDATLRAAFGLAAANLDDRTLTPTAASSANSMWENVITVDDATEAPTTTVFETDQTTDSAARYNEAVLTTRTGTNPAGISRMVTAYAFTNGKVKLTLGTPLPSAPADGDTFTLMGLIDQ